MSSEAVAVLAISIARADAVGGVLVLLTIFFAVLGYQLSKDGLKATTAAAAVTNAVQRAQSVTAEAQQTVARAQSDVAQATGEHADKVAASTESVASSTSQIQGQVAAVNDALKGLTGNQAPARVAWSLCALCLAGALASFGLISADFASNASAAH